MPNAAAAVAALLVVALPSSIHHNALNGLGTAAAMVSVTTAMGSTVAGFKVVVVPKYYQCTSSLKF